MHATHGTPKNSSDPSWLAAFFTTPTRISFAPFVSLRLCAVEMRRDAKRQRAQRNSIQCVRRRRGRRSQRESPERGPSLPPTFTNFKSRPCAGGWVVEACNETNNAHRTLRKDHQ